MLYLVHVQNAHSKIVMKSIKVKIKIKVRISTYMSYGPPQLCILYGLVATRERKKSIFVGQKLDHHAMTIYFYSPIYINRYK